MLDLGTIGKLLPKLSRIWANRNWPIAFGLCFARASGDAAARIHSQRIFISELLKAPCGAAITRDTSMPDFSNLDPLQQRATADFRRASLSSRIIRRMHGLFPCIKRKSISILTEQLADRHEHTKHPSEQLQMMRWLCRRAFLSNSHADVSVKFPMQIRIVDIRQAHNGGTSHQTLL
jgi:hypothetical protein